MKHIILAAALSLVATQYLGATTPSWFETDSAKAISKRLDRDFSLTVEQARHRLLELYGASVAARTEEFIAQGLLETRTTADGNVMVFRKAPSNLKLICPEVSGVEWISRGADADSSDVAIVRAVIAVKAFRNSLRPSRNRKPACIGGRVLSSWSGADHHFPFCGGCALQRGA